jgi:hypothetical protein
MSELRALKWMRLPRIAIHLEDADAEGLGHGWMWGSRMEYFWICILYEGLSERLLNFNPRVAHR